MILYLNKLIRIHLSLKHYCDKNTNAATLYPSQTTQKKINNNRYKMYLRGYVILSIVSTILVIITQILKNINRYKRLGEAHNNYIQQLEASNKALRNEITNINFGEKYTIDDIAELVKYNHDLENENIKIKKENKLIVQEFKENLSPIIQDMSNIVTLSDNVHKENKSQDIQDYIQGKGKYKLNFDNPLNKEVLNRVDALLPQMTFFPSDKLAINEQVDEYIKNHKKASDESIQKIEQQYETLFKTYETQYQKKMKAELKEVCDTFTTKYITALNDNIGKLSNINQSTDDKTIDNIKQTVGQMEESINKWKEITE